MECTQLSISLVSSPWGSPQITTCPETAQVQRAVVLCPHSCTQKGGRHASPYLFEGVMEHGSGPGHLGQGQRDLLQPLREGSQDLPSLFHPLHVAGIRGCSEQVCDSNRVGSGLCSILVCRGHGVTSAQRQDHPCSAQGPHAPSFRRSSSEGSPASLEKYAKPLGSQKSLSCVCWSCRAHSSQLWSREAS